jgi:hypothetical protein
MLEGQTIAGKVDTKTAVPLMFMSLKEVLAYVHHS